MYSVPIDAAVTDRAQWLDQLAAALDQTQQLLAELYLSSEHRALLAELHIRIEAARLEIQALRRSRSLMPRSEFDPQWIGLSPRIIGPFPS